mmetsp:Transcript_64547/g.135472  ORF Transcript_64547/g.135472 Transcript_64547/m.135472 type:complete len:220 (+) Transcript_64547:266-925(+)
MATSTTSRSAFRSSLANSNALGKAFTAISTNSLSSRSVLLAKASPFRFTVMALDIKPRSPRISSVVCCMAFGWLPNAVKTISGSLRSSKLQRSSIRPQTCIASSMVSLSASTSSLAWESRFSQSSCQCLRKAAQAVKSPVPSLRFSNSRLPSRARATFSRMACFSSSKVAAPKALLGIVPVSSAAGGTETPPSKPRSMLERLGSFNVMHKGLLSSFLET